MSASCEAPVLAVVMGRKKGKGEAKEMKKWGLIKLKSFPQQRKLSRQKKDKLQNGRKYLQMM